MAGGLREGAGYVDPAARLLEGLLLPTAGFPPLYPALLALTGAAVGDSPQALRLADVVVGATTIPLTGFLGRRVADLGFGTAPDRALGPLAGLVAAALVAVSPALVASDASLMSEVLYVPLATTLTLAAALALQRRSTRGWALAGLVGGLAALTRPDGLVLTVCVAGSCVLPGRRSGAVGNNRIPSRWLALVAIGVALAVTLPWTARSSAALGGPVLLSTNSDKTLAGANCDLTYRGEMLGRWTIDCVEERPRSVEDEIDQARRWRSSGIGYALDHLTDLPRVGVVRVLRTWGLYDPLDGARADAIESRSRRWQLLAWAAYLPVLAAGAAGAALLARRRPDALAPLAGALAAATSTALISWGNQRFRLAAEPALAVLAAVALVGILDRVTKSDRGREEPS